MNPIDNIRNVAIELKEVQTDDPAMRKILDLCAESMLQCISLVEADLKVITQQSRMINALLAALAVSSGVNPPIPTNPTPIEQIPYDPPLPTPERRDKLITLPVVPDAPTLRSGRYPNITRRTGVGSNDPAHGKHP